MKAWKEYCKVEFARGMTLAGYIVSILLGTIYSMIDNKMEEASAVIVARDSYIAESVLSGFSFGLFFIHPVLLTIMNLLFLFCPATEERYKRLSVRIEKVTLVEGGLYSFLLGYIVVGLIVFAYKDVLDIESWWLLGLTPIVYLAVRGIMGYMRLRKGTDEEQGRKCIRAMNGGVALCLLWVVLMCILGIVLKGDFLFKLLLMYVSLFPLNCILIAWKVIREKKTQ